MKKVVLILILMLIFSTLSHAAEHARTDVAVTSIRAFSESTLATAGLANYTRVYVTNAPWGTSNCRGDSADIAKNDTHLYSLLLTALTVGKTIDMYVDDSIPPVHSTTCRLVNITVR